MPSILTCAFSRFRLLCLTAKDAAFAGSQTVIAKADWRGKFDDLLNFVDARRFFPQFNLGGSVPTCHLTRNSQQNRLTDFFWERRFFTSRESSAGVNEFPVLRVEAEGRSGADHVKSPGQEEIVLGNADLYALL